MRVRRKSKIEKDNKNIELTQTPKEYTFTHRSTKTRAIQRVRNSMPRSPRMRFAVMKAYIKECKSPTAKTLHLERNIDSMHKAVLQDLRDAVLSCKTKRTKDALTAMKVIVTSVSGENVAKAKCMKRLSDELELPVRRITKGRKIRTQIMKSEKSCWTHTLRKTRSDSIDENTKSKCFQFWLSKGISRPTGNKKDIKRQRLGPNLYSSHMIHILEMSQTEVYLKFKKEHQDVIISQRQFEKYKPYYVRSVREQDRETCCCRKHVEIGLLFKTCREYRRKNHDENKEFESLKSVIDATMCESQQPMCVNRECSDCGVKRLSLFPDEMDTRGTVISWEKYEYIKLKIKQQVQSKLMLVKQTTSPAEMFSYFKELLHTFPAHQKRAVWQQKQFKSIVENLRQGDIICVHDFSENYRCGEKQELQTTYFQKTEVTIHVTLLYRHAILECDGVESLPNSPEIITETIFSISSDPQHDNLFVMEVQRRIAEYLQEINYGVVNMIHEFTDGCAAQYRSRYCFNDIRLACETLGCRGLIRNYFETSHAKGPQDAAGGFLKRQADLSVLRGGIIQNAHDLFQFGLLRLKENKTTALNRRLFWYIPEIQRAPRDNVKAVLGIRSVHQVKSDSLDGSLKSRYLSCYSCESCLNNTEPCEQSDVVGKFKSVNFSQKEPVEMEDEYIYEEIGLLGVGMIVAVLADDPQTEYYLMELRKTPHTLRKDCVDVWGSSFSKGSSVMCGTYFDYVDGNPLNLKKVKGKLAFVYTSAYIYTCADVDADSQLHLPEEVHLNILARLQELTGVV